MQEEDPIYGNSANRARKKSEIIQPVNKPRCVECGFAGDMVIVKKHGCASISWVVCLTLFTGILFWIPLVRGDCKDKVMVCPECCREIEIEFADCF